MPSLSPQLRCWLELVWDVRFVPIHSLAKFKKYLMQQQSWLFILTYYQCYKSLVSKEGQQRANRPSDPKAFRSSIYYTGSGINELFICNPEIRRFIEQINQLSPADQVRESNREKQVQSTGRYMTEFLCLAAFIPKPGKAMERQLGLGTGDLWDKFVHTPVLLNNAALDLFRGKTTFWWQLTWATIESLVLENINCPHTRESVQIMWLFDASHA